MRKNAKSILLSLLIVVAVALASAIFVACNVDDVKEISVTPETVNVRIGEFNYADYTVTATYDSGRTETAELKEDMIAPKDRLKFFVEGEYEIEVNYLRKTTTMQVTVRRNVFEGAEFNDLDVVYNGEFYTVEVKNVPEGTTVSYPSTNRFRNAGEYQATAILRKDAFEMKEMTAKVTIHKADYDLSKVVFADKTEGYDGTAHTLEMTGELPAGLYVDYTITREGGREEKGNSATNAGVYRVDARFSGDYVNYNTIDNKQATLTIRRAEIDVSSLKFEDKTVVYDRTKQSIVLEGTLPRGVTVSYINNEHVDAGAYEAKAVFAVDDTVNYAPIPSKKATLTIQKADYDMSSVHFNGTKVVYDGKEKRIEIEGQLPTGLTISYTDNVATDAGTYLATATFASQNVNYNDPESLTATLIIDKATAPMGQITYERRRFISQKGTQEGDAWFWEMLAQMDEETRAAYETTEAYAEMCARRLYDPYLAAKKYMPQNVPTGLAISSVKYKETAGWVDDLTAYDGVGDGYLGEDQLDHDGYYVVVVNFDGGVNYTGVSPVRTLIRVDTIESLSTWEQLVYDDNWRNPATGEETGVFMDYYRGSCVPWSDSVGVTIGDVTIRYCDCNVFLRYFDEGRDALVSDEAVYTSNSKLADYLTLANCYFDFIRHTDIDFDSSAAEPREWQYRFSFDDLDTDGVSEAFKAFLSAAETASSTPEEEWAYTAFDLDKAAYIPLNDSYDYLAITDFEGGWDTPLHSQYMCKDEAAIYLNFDETNPFAMIAGMFGELDSLSAHATGAAAPSIVAAADALSEHFAAFLANLPTDGSAYFSNIDGAALDSYTLFYNAAIDLYDNALVSFVKNLGGALSDSAVIGLNHPLRVLLGSAVDASEIDLQAAIANLFGYEAKEDFVHDVEALAAVYSQYRTDLANSSGTNAALSDGCFLADNGSFVFPFVFNNKWSHAVLTFLIVDATSKVSIWVNDVEAVLVATCFDADHMPDYFVENYMYGKDLLFVKGPKTVDDYYQALARIFGFDDVDAFFGWDKVTGNTLETYRDATFLAEAGISMDSAAARLACTGGIYNSNGEDYAFIFPYVLRWNTDNGFRMEYIYIFAATIGGAKEFGVLLSDAQGLFEFMDFAAEQETQLEGRCTTAEFPVTRLTPKTKTVIENGVEVQRVMTSGKDFIFIEQNQATSHLVYEDFEVYLFLSEIPGNCAENTAGYDAANYRIETAQAAYSYCDCDPFASIIKAGGTADVAKRDERADHAQMTSEVAAKFDRLAELYRAFVSNYSVGEDVVNEWKIGASNRNYSAYKAFFEYAADMMAKSDRNMGKNNSYVLSKSVLVGMNRAFSISINGSGNEYTVDQYRTIVAKLFGFADLDALTAYVNALADALVTNARNANVDTVSARLVYDGAVLTADGYYVLPYAIKSETSLSKVMALIFVGPDGTTTIWLNDARNAYNATNFGEEEWEAGDKYNVTIYGRCMLFEDNGYIMNEDLSKNVVDMIDNLLNVANNLFAVENDVENCAETNSYADDNTYWYNKGDAIYIFCDCDPFATIIKSCGNLFSRKTTRDGGVEVIATYDGCNPIGLMANDCEIIYDRQDESVAAATVDAFNELAQSFAAFMHDFVIPKDGSAFAPTVDGEALSHYTAFYDRAMALMDTTPASHFANVTKTPAGSAVIGANYPYVMLLGEGVSGVDLQAIVAGLFGFDVKEAFVQYAQQLAEACALFRSNLDENGIFDTALARGCFYTTNRSLVYPFVVKNDVSNPILVYLVIDDEGFVSVWVNDLEATLRAVGYDGYRDEGTKTIANRFYCKNTVFAEVSIANRADRDDHAQMTQAVVDKFDALASLYGALLSHYTIDGSAANVWSVVGGDNYAEYRRLFRYARDMFAAANNGTDGVGDYLMAGSAIVGVNRSFVIAGGSAEYTVAQYQEMLAQLFGFDDAETFVAFADALAKALSTNARNADVDTIAARLIYDGAVLTASGYYVLPYAITNDASRICVLAFVFVDAEGNMSVWLNNVDSAFAVVDFTELSSEGSARDILSVDGRCVLFENSDYVGYEFNRKDKYVAVEKIKTFASAGDFLVYSPFTDDEGFEVYWFSVYDHDLEVVYDDADNEAFGTVHKGFYTMINVASIDDVRQYNQGIVNAYTAGGEE